MIDYDLLRSELKKFVIKTAVNVELATIKSVDKQKCVCVCVLISDGLEIKARLRSVEDKKEGILFFPKVGSPVTLLQDNNTWSVLMVSEVEEVVFFAGGNGGMVKVAELVERLNKIETAFNTLLNHYKSHNHSHPQGPTINLIVPSTQQNLQRTQKTDIENEHIKH